MASDGSVNPWPAQDRIRDAGANGAITSIKADGTQVYGTGYSFTQNGTADWEGTFAIDPTSGQINWANDCLGDTYDIAPAGDVLYNASHQHDCTRRRRVARHQPPRALAEGRGVSTRTPPATPRRRTTPTAGPAATAWSVSPTPSCCTGTRTSRSAPTPAPGRPAWAVDASPDGQWVVYGGEFPRVNNVAQQGLVRFRTTCRGAEQVAGRPTRPCRRRRRPTTNAVSLTRGHGARVVGLGVGHGRPDPHL